jgi:hypothetical protein
MNVKAIKRILITASSIGILSHTLIASADMTSFKDVENTSSYASDIQHLKQKGVIDGNKDEVFDPHVNIKRAEFVKMVVAGFSLPLDFGHFHFYDLDSHWAAQYVQTAYNQGIIDGTDGYKFAPDAPIKREEAAVIVWRLLQKQGIQPSVISFMLPNNVDDWAREAVSQCIATNMFGVPFASGTYQDSLSREEAAALIDMSMKISKKVPEPSDDYINSAYGFSLKLPKSWAGRYDVIDRKNEVGHNIEFKNKSTKTGILFTVSVWTKQYWNVNGEDIIRNVHASKVGVDDSNVYVFLTPTDVQYDPSDLKARTDYEMMFNDVAKIKSSFEMYNIQLTDNEVKDILKGLIPKAVAIYGMFNGTGWFKVDATKTIPGEKDYCLVTGESWKTEIDTNNVKSIADLKKVVEDVFTKDMAQKLFYSRYLDPLYKDYEGQLYVNTRNGGHGWAEKFLIDTAKLKGQKDNVAEIELDKTTLDLPAEKLTISIEYVNDKWLMASATY